MLYPLDSDEKDSKKSRTKADYSLTPASSKRRDIGYETDTAFYKGKTPQEFAELTVITPFFNTGEIFKDTARSLERQTFQNYLWLVVDDKSTDSEALETLAWLEAKGDKRVRVIHMPKNVGVSAARNHAVKQARTEFIAFLDSDDLIEPTTFEKEICFLASHPQYYFCNGYIVGFDAMQYQWRHGFQDGAAFLKRNQTNPIGVYRRKLFTEIGAYDEDIKAGLEDWEFWLRCANAGKWGYTIEEFLTWYRRRPSHTDRWADFDEKARMATAGKSFLARFPRLDKKSFPKPQRKFAYQDFAKRILQPFAFANKIKKSSALNVLLLQPHVELGGADKFNYDVIEQLGKDGTCRFTTLATLPKAGRRFNQLAQLAPDAFHLASFLEVEDYAAFLDYLIKSRQTDVVLITHSVLAYHLIPHLRCHHPDLPIVDYLHIETTEWRDGGYPLYSAIYRHMFDASAVSSEYLRKWTCKRNLSRVLQENLAKGDSSSKKLKLLERQANIDDAKVRVIYTNINTQIWNPQEFDPIEIKDEFALRQDCPLLLFAARLDEQKQPMLMMEVCRRLAEHDCDFQLAIAGDGEYEKEAHKFATDCGLEESGKLRFLGALEFEQVQRLLGAVDIYFLPSKHEGIALGLYEAMAMACVCVASDVSGQSELLSEDCGFLIKNDSRAIENYTEALRRLVEDKNLRNKMRQNARRRVVENFGIEKMRTQMLDLLQSVVAVKKSRQKAIIQAPEEEELCSELCSELRSFLHTILVAEAYRFEHDSVNFWRELDAMRRASGVTQKMKKLEKKLLERDKKLENFRGMIKRRDEKLAKLQKKRKRK